MLKPPPKIPIILLFQINVNLELFKHSHLRKIKQMERIRSMKAVGGSL